MTICYYDVFFLFPRMSLLKRFPLYLYNINFHIIWKRFPLPTATGRLINRMLFVSKQSKNRAIWVAMDWTTVRYSTTGLQSCSGVVRRRRTTRPTTTWRCGVGAAPLRCSTTNCRWRTSQSACPIVGRPSPASFRYGRALGNLTSTKFVGK